ncbi:MAG: type IV secretory system conjugative DNA transfer family protein, partial [Sphingomonas sp.]
KRISDALGTATEMRAMKNYAGHRLSPWLGHLMVSRTETARALLTPGEVMQLPSDEEIVMVAGVRPIRARKVRYYADPRLSSRVQAPPAADSAMPLCHNDWTDLAVSQRPAAAQPGHGSGDDTANGGIRREPDLPREQEVVPPPAPALSEFEFDDQGGDETIAARRLDDRMRGSARQASLDPDDGVVL